MRAKTARMVAGRPKRKVEYNGGIAEKKWADPAVFGLARWSSACFLEGFWCVFSNKCLQCSQSWVENPAASLLLFSGLVVKHSLLLRFLL